MTTVTIAPSSRKGKRLMASFPEGAVHFGAKQASTYIDHKDDKIKAAWIARHRVNEDHGNLRTAGALARHVLWEKPSITQALRHLNARQSKYRFVNGS